MATNNQVSLQEQYTNFLYMLIRLPSLETLSNRLNILQTKFRESFLLNKYPHI